MIRRLSEAQRSQQFQQQLQDAAMRVVTEFLTEQRFEVVRQEYAIHFDDIKAAINNPNNTFRTCVEDIVRLSPVIAAALSNERIFFQELHRAIKEGYLTKDDLE